MPDAPDTVPELVEGSRSDASTGSAIEPVPSTNHPYSPTTVQTLEPAPPVPHDTSTDTFA
jgi:hypothetical protein